MVSFFSPRLRTHTNNPRSFVNLFFFAGLIPKTTSSSAGAAAATGAPMDVIPAMGLAGAVGALAAAVAL